MARPRVALFTGHFPPCNRVGPSVVQWVRVRSRSDPRPDSVNPQDTAAPESTMDAMRWAMSPPANQAQSAPRKVLPCATAAVRSRLATCLVSNIVSSRSCSSPPNRVGT